MRTWILALAWFTACGPTHPRVIPTAEPPHDAGVVLAPDATCPKQCMDTCCQANETCQHGRGDDGTFAYCRKAH